MSPNNMFLLFPAFIALWNRYMGITFAFSAILIILNPNKSLLRKLKFDFMSRIAPIFSTLFTPGLFYNIT